MPLQSHEEVNFVQKNKNRAHDFKTRIWDADADRAQSQ